MQWESATTRDGVDVDGGRQRVAADVSERDHGSGN